MVKLEKCVVKIQKLDSQIWQSFHDLTTDTVRWKTLELGGQVSSSLNLVVRNIILGTLNNNNL